MNKNQKKNIVKGRWYEINKKIEKTITAKYHKIKDWVMDPKGYFLITIDRACKSNNRELFNFSPCKTKRNSLF